ncbi:MAG: NAD(P)/FAD-dependent oxidoreductase [Actinobacteria bacterium]|jgi:NADH dehydrogenase|nr:NAD(P)/FAD-dependent oxidoreductase [Micrococcales bacterium]MCB0903927.1 NAD(P)/FAD-dependent oxidoreductase [Actinomycetota bacterium]MCO5299876.1 NAD(P)/FAD-dependent oxidoreductase [Candidatus Nanopelagicales bacterium]MCB9429654.1 NAD(P)/FAD-dependent oxidoreductase [Actinomycetota bacterium]HPE12699.1 NAD(P)/FAD-dependent oxidoreductase [Actinomycetota bacterium]
MTAKHRVVIIGSGFGGLFAAKRLKRADAEVTLISRVSHHTFQPLLYQVATGILSQGEIAPATREILKRQDNVEVLLGDVTTIDLSARTVTSSVGVLQTITEYDSLIVAAGATTGYFGNDEFEPFAPGLKSIDDALELRARVFGAFEMAELQQEAADAEPWMTFVVVGAGPTGVELAGQIVELSHRTLKRDFRRIDPRDARVILVEGGDGVLSSFGPKQSRRAGEQLERMGIDVRLQGMVEDVDESGVTVKYRDGSTQHIATRCVLWAAGVAASPLGRQLAEQSGAGLDRAGRVQVRSDLTLPGHDEVFVIGDMIALDDLPGVAQVAMQGAKFSAKKIRARIDGKPEPTQFSYFDKGSMATISRFRAVANVGSLELRGFLAWVAWLFIHILYLVGFRAKLSTLGHWAVAFIGRARSERTFTLEQARGALTDERERRDLEAG